MRHHPLHRKINRLKRTNKLMNYPFRFDRYSLRATFGALATTLGFLGLQYLDSGFTWISLLVFASGVIALVSGVPWIGADREARLQDDTIESRYPIGHAYCAGAMAIFGLWMLYLSVEQFESEPFSITIICALFGLGFAIFGGATAMHCATFRIWHENQTVFSTGGIFSSKRVGPFPMAEISKRRGVEILSKYPRTYRLNFVRKRSLDLPSHMTGTQAILKLADAYYANDYRWDRHPKED